MAEEDRQFCIRLSRKAGRLLVKYYRSTDLDSRLKKDLSVVTDADLAADELLSSSILKKFPSDVLLSEEIHPSFHSSEINPVWIIDPLDGTTNFALGIHYWGTLVTKVDQGESVATAMYFPILDELYSAGKGNGAWLNDQPIHVETVSRHKKTSFFSCCSRTHRNYQVEIPYKIRVFGSAAYSMCALARGAARVAFEAQAKVWDIAGAWLLVKEAGGVIAPLRGNDPFPLIENGDYSQIDFPILAAACLEEFEKSRQRITPKSTG